MRKLRYLELGSISTGTLRPEDVIPALLDACDTVRMSREDRAKVVQLRKLWAYESTEDPKYAGINVDHDGTWDEVLELLQAYAPPFCYVGAHPGDGADIGVWVDDAAVQDNKGGPDCPMDYTIWCGEGPIPRESEAVYRLVVSDHGNMTLYHRSNGKVVWGIV